MGLTIGRTCPRNIHAQERKTQANERYTENWAACLFSGFLKEQRWSMEIQRRCEDMPAIAATSRRKSTGCSSAMKSFIWKQNKFLLKAAVAAKGTVFCLFSSSKFQLLCCVYFVSVFCVCFRGSFGYFSNGKRSLFSFFLFFLLLFKDSVQSFHSKIFHRGSFFDQNLF